MLFLLRTARLSLGSKISIMMFSWNPLAEMTPCCMTAISTSGVASANAATRVKSREPSARGRDRSDHLPILRRPSQKRIDVTTERLPAGRTFLVRRAYRVGMLDVMELRRLRYFVAVAEEENVTRAATRLHVSQPPLSRQIRSLEKELGVDLFDRSANRLRLTMAGETFLIEARALLQHADEAVDLLKAVAV